MTGAEWNRYFISDDPLHKARVLEALETLAADSMFRKAYGSDFAELAALIKYPLNPGVEIRMKGGAS